LKPIALALAVLLLPLAEALAAEPQWNDAIPLVTAYTYQGGADEPLPKARALALFGARQEAIRTAAKYLTHKGLLEHYGKKENEIFCLAANEIETVLLEQRYDADRHAYFVRIRTATTLVDFIRAQIKDLEMEKQEAAFSYSREMKQPVMKTVDPAAELSRAYRYIRKQQWRIAIIYLDHLEKKYPYWGDVFLAKAIALYGINAAEQMTAALQQACNLQNQEACRELRSMAAPSP
jgi:hypothetical protein